MDECKPLLMGAGVVVISTDRLAHPLAALDTIESRITLAECVARLWFGQGRLAVRPPLLQETEGRLT